MGEVRVKLALADGFRTQIKAGAHTLVADEPRGAGGGDRGPSPYDLLLAALGACTAMTLKMYVERKRWPVAEIEVLLSIDRIHAVDCESCSDLAPDAEIEHISRLIYVTGEVTEEQSQRLLEIAARCPVHATLRGRPHIEDALIVRP